MPDKLLEVINLKKYFHLRKGFFQSSHFILKALDGVSLTLDKAEVLGVVGESGCGKSTLGRTILCLYPASEGKVFFEGCDLFALGKEELRRLRKRMQIIFQDPYSSLNPRQTVRAMLVEVLHTHGVRDKAVIREQVCYTLSRVGISPSQANKYPHEFSGGQRQRICIARAIMLNPSFIMADEPTSALDVSIQAQILNLIKELQEELGLAYLFISHDLAVVKYVSGRIAVMYLGKLVELAPTKELFRSPCHPYTEALLSAYPLPEPGAPMKLTRLEGEIPSPINPPRGCRFHPRCPRRFSPCDKVEPNLLPLDGGHLVACHLFHSYR